MAHERKKCKHKRVDICFVSYNSIAGTDGIFLSDLFWPELNALSFGMLFIYVCEIFTEIKII